MDHKTHGPMIGAGSFGYVEECFHEKLGKIVACKVLDFPHDLSTAEEANRELSILEQVKHPNIVSYLGYEFSICEARLYMELCPGGSLRNFINKHGHEPIPEHIVWEFLRQISSALIYCHEGVHFREGRQIHAPAAGSWLPVLHGDIKPENILLSYNDHGRVLFKLADFGLSKLLENGDVLSSLKGTLGFLSPEMSDTKRALRWSKKSDIFSLGATIHVMCTRTPTPFKFRMGTLEDRAQPSLPEVYSNGLHKCVNACMSYIPTHRPDTHDLIRWSAKKYYCPMFGCVFSKEGFLEKLEEKRLAELKPFSLEAVCYSIENEHPFASADLVLFHYIQKHYNVRISVVFWRPPLVAGYIKYRCPRAHSAVCPGEHMRFEDVVECLKEDTKKFTGKIHGYISDTEYIQKALEKYLRLSGYPLWQDPGLGKGYYTCTGSTKQCSIRSVGLFDILHHLRTAHPDTFSRISQPATLTKDKYVIR